MTEASGAVRIPRFGLADGAARVGLAWLVLMAVLAVLAPVVAQHAPTDVAPGSRFLPPSLEHWLGTDRLGRDVFSRLLYGARVSLSVGVLAMAMSATVGTMVGAVAGFLGGWVDTILMRLVDVVLAFPRLVLLLALMAAFEQPSMTTLILVLGLTQWPATARLVRAEVLSLRDREFVEAARVLGFGGPRILFRHILPNALAPAIVAATLEVGNVILLEAGLSFLGLGIPPSTPSWGTMIADGRSVLVSAWWLSTAPGLAIVSVVVAFNLVGDGLRDALDPRTRRDR